MRNEIRLDTNDPEVVAWLEKTALPDWIRQRRWFSGDRTATSPRLRFEELGQSPDGLILGLAATMFEPHATTPYLLALFAMPAEEAEAIDRQARIAEIPVSFSAEKAILTDAAFSATGRQAILRLTTGETALGWSFGTVKGRVFERRHSESQPSDWQHDSRTLAGTEQSNTSLVYGNAAILKLLRRPGSPGFPNPDVEIPLALSVTTAEPLTPPVIGVIQAGDDSAGLILATLCRFLPDATTGWDMALKAEKAAMAAPLDANEQTADDARLGRDLAIRTAELHQALSRIPDNDAFAPVPIRPADLKSLSQDLKAWSRGILAKIEHRKNATGSATITQRLGQILRNTGIIDAIFDRLDPDDRFDPDKPLFFAARHHGDFHLGQVLWSEDLGWQVIDFEGEPNRDIEERRRKAIALRDVAGMVRSFDYAQAVTCRESNADAAQNENARNWRDRVSDTFVHTWFAMVGDVEHEIFPLIPADYRLRKSILDAFVLEKNLYELIYEMDFRPDWIEVPLNALCELLEIDAG